MNIRYDARVKRCLIVGAGAMAREVLSWALHVQQSDWTVAGFLDADSQALEGKNFPYQVLGDPATWAPSDEEVFIPGIGDPATRLRVCSELKAKSARFATIVHPSVIQAMNVRIGEGCVVSPNVVISAGAVVEDFVFINIAASIGHDTVTGQGTTVSSHCDLMGGVKVGRACFIGGHACILPGKKVGDGAIVGAGSAVVRNVAAGTTVMGVPAQLLSSRTA